MLKRIDFFTTINQYSSTVYFTERFKEALEQKGVSCRVFDLEDGNFRDYIQLLSQDPPDMTCSFNYIRYGKFDTWLCDALRLPHLTYGLDGTIYCIDHFKHPFALFSTVDQLDWEGLKPMGGERILFLPHAIEKTFEPAPFSERPYDIVFCGTYIDYELEFESWRLKFIPSVCEMMEMAAEIILTDPSVSILMGLEKAKNHFQLDLSGLFLEEVYASVERYCKGKDRIEMIKALKGFNIHIFGSHLGPKDWRRSLAGYPNVVLHAPVSFVESLEILQKSKIIINSSPQFRHGSHERVFYGLAADCAVITNENFYLKTQFGRGRGLLYYLSGREKELQDQVQELLANPQLRQDQVALGRKHVLNYHTWDNRYEDLNRQWGKIEFPVEEAWGAFV